MKTAIGIVLAMATTTVIAAAAADPEAAPVAKGVAPGVWMIPGGIRPDLQPDGNTVVFEAPEGLVVVDTGRHEWHRAAILRLARERGRPVAAVVNTHWHLDHVSGNPGLRAAYPGLRVHASVAINGALEGFLAESAKDAAAYLSDPQVPEATREDIRADLRTIENGAALRPDVAIERSGVLHIGGRDFAVHLARDAVTAGDVWLYDESSRVAVLGDLVTLPAPFLDTACPEGWRAALEEVTGVPFEVAIPGHGRPMSREEVARYRGALDGFVDCARSTAPAADCATRWTEAVEPLFEDVAEDEPRARGLARYYVDMLRANGGRSRHCAATDGGSRGSSLTP
ncbi:MAG: MBL fold metallo-hydrolase [Lysobacterales bacterium]|nr:MAG: MBL fold metallo-hydrolase [Xanthomonadales bacterium]